MYRKHAPIDHDPIHETIQRFEGGEKKKKREENSGSRQPQINRHTKTTLFARIIFPPSLFKYQTCLEAI